MKNKKIKTLQRKVFRRAKTIRGLMAVLQEKKILSSELAAILERNFEHIELVYFKTKYLIFL